MRRLNTCLASRSPGIVMVVTSQRPHFEHVPAPRSPGTGEGGCYVVSQTSPSNEKFVRGAGSQDYLVTTNNY